jgi:hypothetical protein
MALLCQTSLPVAASCFGEHRKCLFCLSQCSGEHVTTFDPCGTTLLGQGFFHGQSRLGMNCPLSILPIPRGIPMWGYPPLSFEPCRVKRSASFLFVCDPPTSCPRESPGIPESSFGRLIESKSIFRICASCCESTTAEVLRTRCHRPSASKDVLHSKYTKPHEICAQIMNGWSKSRKTLD